MERRGVFAVGKHERPTAAIWTTLALIVAGVAGCSQHGATTPTPQASRVGIYSFTEHPPQAERPFQGRVGVTNDTVVVEWDSGPCYYDERSTAGTGVIYHCGPITVVFSRVDPVPTARYSLMTTVQDRQTSCAQYTTDTHGNQICTRQQTETIERQVPVNGILHLEAISKPD